MLKNRQPAFEAFGAALSAFAEEEQQLFVCAVISAPPHSRRQPWCSAETPTTRPKRKQAKKEPTPTPKGQRRRELREARNCRRRSPPNMGSNISKDAGKSSGADVEAPSPATNQSKSSQLGQNRGT